MKTVNFRDGGFQKPHLTGDVSGRQIGLQGWLLRRLHQFSEGPGQWQPDGDRVLVELM